MICCRYSIDWKSDLDSFFDIDPVEGTISTNELLDRESIAQHNISIVATKVSKYDSKSFSVCPESFEPIRMDLSLSFFFYYSSLGAMATPMIGRVNGLGQATVSK